LCLLFFIEDGSLARRGRDGAYHGAVGKTGKNFHFLARATNITAPRSRTFTVPPCANLKKQW